MWNFDPSFGVNNKALAIALIIDLENIPGISTAHAISWSPFYNGREKGICLAVRKPDSRNYITKYWVFGENRNSDEIFLDTFILGIALNPPTVKDMKDEDYRRRKMWGYWCYKDVAEEVTRQVTEFIQEVIT